MTRSLRHAPIFLALLLPVVAFLVIGRTVEIKKTLDGAPPVPGQQEVLITPTKAFGHLVTMRIGLAGSSSAGAGLSMCSRQKVNPSDWSQPRSPFSFPLN